MSRKKRGKKGQPSYHPQEITNTGNDLPAPSGNFDSLEAEIRGEEILLNEEHRKSKEEHQLKRKLDDLEIERRLNELKKQAGLKK